MQRTHRHIVIAVLGLLLAAQLAVAQSFDRNSFYLNNIGPALDRLDALSIQRLDADAPQLPTPDQYDLTYTGGLSLRRSFARSVSDFATAPLGIAFQEHTVTQASLGLGERTGLSFSTDSTRHNSLWGDALDQRRVDTYGLTQAFGKGQAASSLGLTHSVTQVTPYLGATTTTRVDAMNFQSGLTKSADFALKLSQTDIDLVGGYLERDLQGTLNLDFSGGLSPLGFARNTKLINGVSTVTEKVDLVAPFAWDGQKVLAEHHSSYTNAGGALSKLRTTHLGLPLGVVGKDVSFDYLLVGQNAGAGLVETRTARLLNPFRINGKVYAAEESLVTLRQGGTTTDTLLTKLCAPLQDGQAVIQRQTVVTESATSSSETRQLSVVLPSIKVNDRLSVQAQRLSTEVVGATTQDVTDFNVSVKPLKPLQVDAKYQLDDRGQMQAIKNRQLHTKWALSDQSSLQGHLTEAEIVGGTANAIRVIEFVRDRASSSLGLRAGVASYDFDNQSIEGARRLEICAGKPDTVELAAAYSEYDPTYLTRHVNDAVVALSLQHNRPNNLAVRWRYEDQPTRVAPLKAVDLAVPTLGGNLQMSYQHNPVAADGYTVRPAKQYDGSFGRKVFGDVNMQVGYRYLEYNETDQVDQNIRIQLDGGTEAGDGKVALSYLTGEFCTPGSDAVIPGSSLDLAYSRLWGDDGKLNLTLRRRTAPAHTFGDGSMEGRVEYSLAF